MTYIVRAIRIPHPNQAKGLEQWLNRPELAGWELVSIGQSSDTNYQIFVWRSLANVADGGHDTLPWKDFAELAEF